MDQEADYVQGFLTRYQISETHGFLRNFELPELPEEFDRWIRIASDLPRLLEQKKLREFVDKLPMVTTDSLTDYPLIRHAHLVFALITNCYIWQNGETDIPNCIPRKLAVPLMDLSSRGNLPSIVCHCDCVLTNYIHTDQSKPLQLGNMTLRYRISGDESCDWFFLATIEVELQIAPAVMTLLRCQYYIDNNMVDEVRNQLNKLSKQIEDVRLAFLRMHEHLGGEEFYNIVRPYLNGWHTDGMVYEGVSLEPIKAYGGSAAQCTGIQALDIFLGIKHEFNKKQFLMTMRDYMPRFHKDFLSRLEEICNTHKFVLRHREDLELAAAYNDCVQAMVTLRSTHIQMVVKYITIQAARIRSNDFDSLQKQGTGGQELLPFLRNIRSTTQAAMVDQNGNSWKDSCV